MLLGVQGRRQEGGTASQEWTPWTHWGGEWGGVVAGLECRAPALALSAVGGTVGCSHSAQVSILLHTSRMNRGGAGPAGWGELLAGEKSQRQPAAGPGLRDHALHCPPSMHPSGPLHLQSPSHSPRGVSPAARVGTTAAHTALGLCCGDPAPQPAPPVPVRSPHSPDGEFKLRDVGDLPTQPLGSCFQSRHS